MDVLLYRPPFACAISRIVRSAFLRAGRNCWTLTTLPIGVSSAAPDLHIMGAAVDTIDNQIAAIVMVIGGAAMDHLPTTGAASVSRSIT